MTPASFWPDGPEPAPLPLSDEPPTLIDGRTCPPVTAGAWCPGCRDTVESLALHNCRESAR